MNPFEFLDEFLNPKTRVLGLSDGEDFVILACVVFTQCQRVTDRQTDRRTDGRLPTIAITGLAATLTPCNESNQCKTAKDIVIVTEHLKCACNRKQDVSE